MRKDREVRAKALELAIDVIVKQSGPKVGVTVTELAEHYYEFLRTGKSPSTGAVVRKLTPVQETRDKTA